MIHLHWFTLSNKQGEGVERNGMFIHTFIPNDAVNYNASHIIHELRFGPDYDLNIKKGKKANLDTNNLNGVTKIVKEEHGMFHLD